MSAQAQQNNAALSHEERLARFAKVTVRVGLGLAPGQELVMTAPIEALPLVRRSPSMPTRRGRRW